jgi:phosphate transport system permease protein
MSGGRSQELGVGSQKKEGRGRSFHATRFDFWSFFFTGLTGLATLFILVIIAVILLNIVINGWSGLTWHFVSTIPKKDFFDPATTGVLPMIVGTTIRVFVMTLFVIPIGVITAIYLTEYAPNTSFVTRIIRGAVNNLAGVPSIVFGLFGLGFFINFIGRNLDRLLQNPGPVWGQPAVLWAALTLALMTMPVVIVATEEALKAIPPACAKPAWRSARPSWKPSSALSCRKHCLAS